LLPAAFFLKEGHLLKILKVLLPQSSDFSTGRLGIVGVTEAQFKVKYNKLNAENFELLLFNLCSFTFSLQGLYLLLLYFTALFSP
jgi:hypothetical protein